MKADKKAKLIERIKTLQGLSDDERGDLLELLRTTKAYGLVWENHREDVEERLRDELPMLIEDKSKALTDGGDDAPNHIIIEGDNLEALTTLAYTHAGKIDVIYIDPPYNTGKKDEFKYNDAWVDKEDTFRHSKWLSFMVKRLRIAKKLLTEKGLIFISIDDHEYSQLKTLCDEIFAGHFVQNFVWYTEGHTDNQDEITDVHEYILCYSKSATVPTINNIVDPNVGDDSKILRNFAENSITKNGKKNPPSEIELPIGFPCEVEKLYLPKSENIEAFLENVRSVGYITREASANFSMKYPVRLCDMKVENYKLSQKCIVFSGWMNNGKLKKFIANNCLPIEDDGTMLKFYLSKNGVIYYRREGRKSHYVQSILMKMGTTETNKYMLERMGVEFDFPKPIELIQYIISLYSKKDSIILDFFAGSATTIHSTMLLNEQDDGNRTCILITNNENQICNKVAYPRIKYIIQNNYISTNNQSRPAHEGNNLRYYRTAFVGRSRTPQNLRRLVRLATDMLCIKEDLYAEQPAFAGQEVVKQAFRYFEKGDKRMLVIYREEAVPLLVPLIEKFEMPQGERIKVYVFSPSEDPWAGEFEEVEEKVTLCALPMAILNAYKRVLPKPKEQNIYVEPEMETQTVAPSNSLFPDFEEGGEA